MKRSLVPIHEQINEQLTSELEQVDAERKTKKYLNRKPKINP